MKTPLVANPEAEGSLATELVKTLGISACLDCSAKIHAGLGKGNDHRRGRELRNHRRRFAPGGVSRPEVPGHGRRPAP